MDHQFMVQGQEFDEDISYQWVKENEDLRSLEQPIALSQLESELEERDQEMEFRVIRRITETQFHNKNLVEFSADIQKFNRSANILPFKHSQVIVNQCVFDELPISETYINANLINCINGLEKKVIATQAPLQSTITQFWKMVILEQCNLIIMLCHLKDGQKMQCEQYWPKNVNETCNMDKIQVTLHEVRTQENLIFRKLTAYSEEWDQKQELVQIQYLEWPDHGVPIDSEFMSVKLLADQAKYHLVNTEGKTLIHCSAGIGRTGTLIAIINVLFSIEHYLNKQEEIQFSIFSIVRRLREQRWGMVHNQEQYQYIYKFSKQWLYFMNLIQ